jgi:epsilon-lactone hydrolase
MRALCASLAQRLASAIGMPLFAVDYRKAPEYRFPAAVDDSLVALRYHLRVISTAIEILTD